MSEGSEETKTKLDSAGESSDVDNENCISSGSGGGSSGETKRTCVDCGTFRTPLWRGGPAGPKSLCNACGIKSRKKRQAALGIKPEKKIRNSIITSDLSLEDDDDHKTCSSKGISRFLDLGFKVPVTKRSSVEKKKRLWSKLGEEERAALLLMALSCASVYA
ncbi:hypothetical protein Bca4012_073987 [Brassica carinata]|uniref:GATA-type domain-containing protein n=2 Tax=Brassica TaxID=3705 RepID=A0A8X7UBT4_BRACI|nr:hypothetical protein Bca52824_066311 [Brassica carinata]VDD46151.1 unnamed protein product [Brassica oleracea]